MKAELTIDMDNAAFDENPAELARILRDLASKVEGGVSLSSVISLRDANGNKVGKMEFSEAEPSATHKM